MYIIKKPPINQDSPRGQDHPVTRFRSGTPTDSTASELERLRKSVHEARATLSGHSTPTSHSPDHPEASASKIIQENLSLRSKIKKLQKTIIESQDVQKLELYEKMIKAEIQKRVEIEKHFAKEADQIQIKVSILEEQMKLRTISDEIIQKFLQIAKGFERIHKDEKKIIRKGHGERVYELILFYEKFIKGLFCDLKVYSEFIDKILRLVLNDELKERLKYVEANVVDPDEKRKAKFELIEAGLSLRMEGEKVIEAFLKGKMYDVLSKDGKGTEGLDREKKKKLKDAFGGGVGNLIEFYEQKLNGNKDLLKEKPDQLPELLEMVLPAEDKARTIKFVKDGDLESAACILRNLNNRGRNERSESVSKISVNTLSVPQGRRSTKSIPYRSLTPNRSSINTRVVEKRPEISAEDLIVFLQCQANGLEDLLINY